MHKLLFITLLSIGILNLSSCVSSAAKPPQNNDVRLLDTDTLNIDTLTPTKMKISAEKSWQSSGIFLENGERVTVSAYGKWSPAPLLLQWSGAEGSIFFAAEVPHITGGALMAKLGHDGAPFEVGIKKTFQANDYGMLYFAMNDPFNWQYDNSGELEVAVYSSNASAKQAQDKKPVAITSYSYDDKTGRGSLSAKVASDHFNTRNWMIKKIGEIASSKRIALRAGSESLQGGSYLVLDESIQDDILTISFETLW